MMSCSTAGFVLTVSLAIPSSVIAQRGAGGGRGAAPAPVVYTPPAAMRAIPDGFVMAVGGDMLGPGRPVSANPLMAPIVKIIAGADAAFANLEGNAFDMSTFTGYAAAVSGGGPGIANGGPVRSPAVMADMKALGIDMVALSNNHGMDLGAEGLFATIRTLDSLGITWAGGGENIEKARAANFYKSPKGNVGLVSTASTFTAVAPAGLPSGRGGRARPGLSFLRADIVTLVNEQEMEQLRKIAARQATSYMLQFPDSVPARQVRIAGPTISASGSAFRLSDKTGVTYDVNRSDETEILNSIAAAESQADLTVFSIHAHETATANGEDPVPADFLPPLFHKAIDAGADVVVRHGPHALTGIEIYKGRPIFYGMASLFSSLVNGEGGRGANGRMYMIPRWSESAIATAEFRGGKVHEIRLYPVVFEAQNPELRSAPLPASPERGRKILEWLQETSKQFGTVVHIENGVGVIRGDGKR